MKPQSTETNETMNNEDGTHIANMCIPLWERLMLGYTTRFDRNLNKWVAGILMDEELRCQQERFLKPVEGESWKSIKMALDELSKPNKNLIQPSFSIDVFRTSADVNPPDHNMSIDDACNMLINNALCNKYWSDLNDKQTKRRKTR